MTDTTFAPELTDSQMDDLFSPSEPSTPDSPDPVETDVDETTVEQPEEAEAPVEAEVPEPTPAEPPAEKPAEAETEDIPEGVTVRDRGGRKEWVYPEDRAKSIYGGYKLAKTAEEIIGEPLTEEAIATRQQAHAWLENQRVDSFSPNPADQANVFRNIFREAASAISNGEIGHDPLETMSEAFLSTLQEMAPEHYEATQNYVMQGVLDRLYQEAAKSGSEKLLRSAQNLDHHLNGKYRADDAVKSMSAKVTPIDQREAKLAERERAIQQHSEAQQKQAWSNWSNSTKTSINESVKSVLTEQIPQDVKTAFEAAPGGQQRLANITKLLDIEVREAMKRDPKWSEQNANLFNLAKMAPTEQRRAAIQQQIVQRYAQKARQVVVAKAPSIIAVETAGIKTANSALHKKLSAGQQQKGSAGPAQPAPRRIPSELPPNMGWEDFIDSRG